MLDAALQYFEAAIQFNGGFEPKYFIPDAYYYSGVIQLQKDNRDTAVQCLGAAVRLYEKMLLYKEFVPHERQRELRVRVFKGDYST